MKQVIVIHVNASDETTTVSFRGQEVQIRRIGCHGDAERASKLIAQYDGKVTAIGLEGMPAQLRLGPARRPHTTGTNLQAVAKSTPVVDGSGIRGGLERWGIILAERANPGMFSQKRILMTPGLNHEGLAQALSRRSPTLRYADPVVFFALPDMPGVGSRQSLDQVAAPTLEQLKNAPFRLLSAQPGQPNIHRTTAPFHWADILAGDIGAIRRYAPNSLKHKMIVVDSAEEADLDDLWQRGATIVVTVLPSLEEKGGLGRWSAATIEAVLVALRHNPNAPLTEDTYLDLLADWDWKPAIRYLQPEEAGINRFAFVIHPLDLRFIYSHPWFRWTRYLPERLVEIFAAYIPPLYISRITGGKSPSTEQRIEGHLIALGATPREMMRHGERFTYNRLNMAAHMAERKGARIMGLGAFTSVVGDAGITVAHEADIAITSGNSLTVAATLEAAKQAAIKMGAQDLTKGKVMIIGATGSIGSVCARLLAQAIKDVVLVSIEPEKLIDLKRTIQSETPSAQVAIATRPDELVGDCDLIVTATSAFGQRILDITKCKPGAVICDVARPPDIGAAEAALRPDVLVIESGEVLIPGNIDFGYDIGLPPKTAYACLGETALLAMEGRFEDYTLGRNITIDRVKEIYRLFKKHHFQLAGLRSFGKYITDEDVVRRRALADTLRANSELFERTKAETAAKLATIPIMAKGVSATHGANGVKWTLAIAGLGMAGLAFLWRQSQRNDDQR
ncbi:MAG: serine carboxypeptidase [Chloroflexales bacterium]|nr:serine carboxypeptidase [Chloroflexales bacterium]